MGADTDPSAFTTRIDPPFSVTRKVPSGRNASDHGALRRSVTICVWNGAEGCGAGAFVCPGNAGLGSGDCATSVATAAVIRTNTAKLVAAFFECTKWLVIRVSCRWSHTLQPLRPPPISSPTVTGLYRIWQKR